MRDITLVILCALAFAAYAYDTEIRCTLGNVSACIRMYPAGIARLQGEKGE